MAIDASDAMKLDTLSEIAPSYPMVESVMIAKEY